MDRQMCHRLLNQLRVRHKLHWLFRNRLLQHILFWVAHVVFYGLLYGSFRGNYDMTFSEELIYLPGRMAFTYYTLYFLLPKFLLPGKYWHFTAWLIVGSVVMGA